MACRIRQFFSGLLLISVIVLGLLLVLGVLNPPSAAAAIRQLEEAPGQMVYQSRQGLKDQHGNSWQTVAFKRVRLDGRTSFELRLVGFPGMVDIDHNQSLTLTNSLGKTLLAEDVSHHIFNDGHSSETNVGQYDLQPLLSQLQTEIPLVLLLPILNHEPVRLAVSPSLVQEWKVVAEQA
jgi:hypothetical protein